jgi:parallel beta-helix repeat protein
MALVPKNAGAPVKAGDTIWLRSGYYGALTLQGAYNTAPLTISAESGSDPRFSNVRVSSAQNWILCGFTVSPSFAPTYSSATIVTLENHNWTGPTYDVVIDSFQIFSVPDESVWTSASDWDTLAASGIYAPASRIAVHGCHVRNVNFGIDMVGQGSRVENCTVDGFCGDGMRGLGDDEVFEYNVVKNRRNVNANHPDGFQSWSLGPGGVGTGVVKNVVLRGNTFIAYESPSIPFAGTIQGIGCFDGFYEGWIVENNVVITDHWHGISLYGARNCRIVNNTVFDIKSTTTGPPWIAVTAHKNGTPSTNCVVRNNLTTTLNVSENVANGIVVDHNLVIPSNPAGYFIDALNRNLRLAPGSPAIDQGSATQAPLLDADQLSRPKGTAFDVGAYEYAP